MHTAASLTLAVASSTDYPAKQQTELTMIVMAEVVSCQEQHIPVKMTPDPAGCDNDLLLMADEAWNACQISFCIVVDERLSSKAKLPVQLEGLNNALNCYRCSLATRWRTGSCWASCRDSNVHFFPTICHLCRDFCEDLLLELSPQLFRCIDMFQRRVNSNSLPHMPTGNVARTSCLSFLFYRRSPLPRSSSSLADKVQQSPNENWRRSELKHCGEICC